MIVHSLFINFLFIFLGLLPSLIWLIFYLRRDVHPEPKRMVVKIFILGMGAAILAAGVEFFLCNYVENLNFSIFVKLFLEIFIVIALVEELVKYLPVHFWVLRNPEFDEPIDAMIYMIISGLGFAAVENILSLFPTPSSYMFQKTFITLLGRFVSATLLHALCSANIGFFLALSFFRYKSRVRLFFSGVFLSTLLHGLYNFGIKIKEINAYNLGVIIEEKYFLLSVFILLFLILLCIYQFKKIKKLKSVCQL
jgi:RsiW-degrading membrane proteinase PrsW (M82 family)